MNKEDFMNQLENELVDYLRNRWSGRAWFNGGSYSYLFDLSKGPGNITTSDDGVLECKRFVDAIEGYADEGIFQDFSETDEDFWGEFFRLAVTDQEDHELKNMRGE
jgi:hypothetical protein